MMDMLFSAVTPDMIIGLLASNLEGQDIGPMLDMIEAQHDALVAANRAATPESDNYPIGLRIVHLVNGKEVEGFVTPLPKVSRAVLVGLLATLGVTTTGYTPDDYKLATDLLGVPVAAPRAMGREG